MIIVFIGAPGSGKGTQAEKLASKLNFFYLSTGEMFRDLRDSRPDIAEVVDKGGLLPDETVLSSLFGYLESKNLFDNIIIDGTPRSLGQYEEMQKWFRSKGSEIKWAIYLDISKEEAVRRLSARRQDKLTGKTYNLITNPPGADVNPQNLIMRDDDKPDVIEQRFEEYMKKTKPLIDELKEKGKLIELNGEEPIEVIFEKMLKRIGVENDNR